jgi:hypothetical protein
VVGEGIKPAALPVALGLAASFDTDFVSFDTRRSRAIVLKFHPVSSAIGRVESPFAAGGAGLG